MLEVWSEPGACAEGRGRYTSFICTVVPRIAVYIFEQQRAEQRRRAEDGLAIGPAIYQPLGLCYPTTLWGFTTEGTVHTRPGRRDARYLPSEA